LLSYTKRQAEEISHGLQSYGKPFLWVVRKEGRAEEVDLCVREAMAAGKAMVVEWCDQQRVLSHPAVGVLRHALRVELDAGGRGARRADGGCAELVGPADERVFGRGVGGGC